VKFKDNITIIVITSVTLVLGLIGLYLISSSSEGLQEAEGNIEIKRGQLNPLLESKPFPSAENIKLVQNSQKEIASAKQQFLDYFNNPAIPKDNIKPIDLRNEIVEFRQEMTTMAKTAEVQIPKDYGFSFEMYGGVLPDDSNTDILYKQLGALKALVPMVLNIDGIEELKSIDRAGLPNEKPTQSARSMNLKITEDSELGLMRLPFEVSFVGDITSLRELVNQMAKSRNLFVVKDVIAKNQNLKIPTLKDMTSEEIEETQKKSSAPRIIFGLDKINVTVRFELLIFNYPGTEPIKSEVQP